MECCIYFYIVFQPCSSSEIMQYANLFRIRFTQADSVFNTLLFCLFSASLARLLVLYVK
jgi:hypothetical protein